MYTCKRCGRPISAEEAVILPAVMEDTDNQILCANCFDRLGQEKHAASTRPFGFRWVFPVGASILFGVAWYGLFLITGYPWDFLSVLGGWGIARTILSVGMRGNDTRPDIFAIVLTLTMILVREYLLLGLVSEYTRLSGDTAALLHLIPLSVFFQALQEKLIANPFTILMWMVSLWIAYSTVVALKRK